MLNDPIVIRGAERPDLPAIERLLPEALHTAERCHFAVAVHRASGTIAGVVGITQVLLAEPLVGPRAAVRVHEAYRRRGAGRSLIDHVRRLRHPGNVQTLHAWRVCAADDDEHRAWVGLGFQVLEEMLEHESPLQQVLERYGSLYEQLKQHGDVPADARVVPLAPEHADAVARMHVQCLGGDLREMQGLLRSTSPQIYSPRCSYVLVRGDGRVLGFTLSRIVEEGTCVLDADVIDPGARQGWANLMLKYEATRQAVASGVHTVRFRTLAQHRDSRKVARQIDARLVRTLLRMHRPLPPAPPRQSPFSATPIRSE